MKKLLIILAAILAFTCVCVSAETQPYTVYNAGTYMSADFDSDGKTEKMSLSAKLDEYNDGSFTLTVNGQALAVDNCMGLEATVYAMLYNYSTLFMVNEYGPSDDPITYCFYYSDGKLTYAGSIPALVSNFSVSKSGVITAQVRANTIGTWYRDSDYVLAWGYAFDDSGYGYESYAYICEVPRDIYAMGMVVKMRTDLPLYASRYDTSASSKVYAGENVILAASDDVRWLYITDLSGENKGWVMMQRVDYCDYIIKGQKLISADEVFDNILYAD